VNYSLFAIVGLIALGFSFSFAYAHTTVEVGPYEIEVGWQDEPPVVGILNAITIDIREPGDVEGVSMGVNNAFKNLRASVVSGGASKVLDINTDPRPGHYYAKIIPTKTGSLEMKLQGEVNGIKINETIIALTCEFLKYWNAKIIIAAKNITWPALPPVINILKVIVRAKNVYTTLSS